MSGEITGKYDKIHLVPFGEYIPLSNLLFFIGSLGEGIGDFKPGKEFFNFSLPQGKFGVLICFEIIFPDLCRRFVKRGANFLVTITNDAWFGRSVAPYQHLLVSIPRTVETRRYLLRSTNTGISAIIDPAGRVVKKTPIFVQTNLEGEVGLMNGNETLYTRVGDVFPVACLVFWIGFAAITRLRGKDIS